MMCAVCMFDGRRQEDLIDLKDGQIDQLRQDLASAQARVAELTDELQMECEARQRVRALLRELVALVRGECPSLLNEDSGGDAKLSCDIDEALKEKT